MRYKNHHARKSHEGNRAQSHLFWKDLSRGHCFSSRVYHSFICILSKAAILLQRTRHRRRRPQSPPPAVSIFTTTSKLDRYSKMRLADFRRRLYLACCRHRWVPWVRQENPHHQLGVVPNRTSPCFLWQPAPCLAAVAAQAPVPLFLARNATSRHREREYHHERSFKYRFVFTLLKKRYLYFRPMVCSLP